ncbi:MULTISPECIES: aldo/keto reductase [Anaerolinea]|uniref:aldo/keto reductase n=1 Tax=Anaerolinea TaxID=233189 RepID=UPI002636DD6D|nr:aldo/keto reductase [Anaerolinea thermophila]
MEYRRLGNSGLKVARICLGTMQFGWTADEKTAFEVMDAYFEAGGNFIDTADVYSAWVPGNPGGVSEEIIGRWMKARKNRHLIVLATKFNGRMWEGPNGDGLSRGHVMKAIEDSLRRLQTDYIDLYQTHWPHYDTPQEETLRALDDLIKAGKVRYIGASNEPAWRLMKAMWISDKYNLNRFISLQPPYSLVKRAEFERELEAVCLDQGIGVIPYSPLQGGFLTGKYRRGVIPDSARAEGLKRFFTEKNFALIDLLEETGKKHNATVTQVALAWMLQRPAITAPIIGANNVAQLRDILGSLNVQLTPEDVTAIDQASDWRES